MDTIPAQPNYIGLPIFTSHRPINSGTNSTTRFRPYPYSNKGIRPASQIHSDQNTNQTTINSNLNANGNSPSQIAISNGNSAPITNSLNGQGGSIVVQQTVSYILNHLNSQKSNGSHVIINRHPLHSGNTKIIASTGAVQNGSSTTNSTGSSTASNNGSNSDSNLNENGPKLADRYSMSEQLPGSSFYNCKDIKTGEKFICKAIGNSYQKILNAYFRMDGFEHIKPLHKLLQSSTDETYLLLPPSQFGDLHSFVRERKRLREPEARHLFRQICKTVKKCHQQGIVLRDLKLRKFVFSDKERTHLKFESLEDAVVLEDYDDDILKEKIGCPAYVAPEILKPNSDFSGKAADLWSLGVILYTMLVGRYPFNDPEHSSLFAKIARCTFTIPDFVSPKARCLVKSLLQKVPIHRLASDDLLDHPWLHEDPMITPIGGSYDSCNSNLNIGSFALTAATNTYELSQDDQRVPEMETPEFT